MPRTPGSHSVNTGPRIRDAAVRLIARHGYAAVSTRQIAAEAGVQAGTIYLYYTDKQALLFELMDDIMDTLHAGWAAKSASDNPMQALRSFVEYCIDFSIDRPDDVLVAYLEMRNLSPENRAVIERKRRAYEEELQSILARGVEAGTVDISDLRLETIAILTMVTAVGNWYREGGRLSRADIQAIYWRLVHRMVGGH